MPAKKASSASLSSASSPTTLETMARAFDQISERTPTLAANLDMRLISVDPERDSPEALNQYVQYFHPRLNAATGSEVELESFAAQLGALFLRVETGNDYTMDHSAGIFIVDPELRLVSVVTPPHNAPAITNRLIKVESFIRSLQ